MITIKATAALLSVAAAAGLLALAAPAQALTIKGSSTDLTVHITKPKNDVDLRIRSGDGRVVVPLFDAGEAVVYLQAGSTGQGDSEEECNNRGDLINAWDNLIGAALDIGDFESVELASANMLSEVDAAMEAGCFIVYKAGPPPEPEPEIG